MKGLNVFQRMPRKLTIAGMLAVLAAGIATPIMPAFAATSSCDLQCVQQFGDQKITERQTALTTLANKISAHVSAGRLTSAQASAIMTGVTHDQNGLSALKSRLDSETTEQAARTDVRDIYYNLRIYAVVLPRAYHHVWLDILVNVDAKLRALAPKIKSAIQRAPASEQGQLNPLYADYQGQLREAEAQIDAAQGQIAALTVQNFNTARSVYTTAYTDYVNDIKTAHTDIKTAAGDLHQIVRIIRGAKLSTGSPATSPTATDIASA